MQPNVINPSQATQPNNAVPVQPQANPVASQVNQPYQPAAFMADTQPTAAYQALEPVAKAQHRGLKLAVSGLTLCAVFALGFFANSTVTSISQKNAHSQAVAFVAALNAGNNQKAYAMTSASLKQQQSESQFSSALGDLKAQNVSYDSQSTAFNDRTATYTAVEEGLPADAEGSTTGTFQVSLVKSGVTGWKIDSVNVQ